MSITARSLPNIALIKYWGNAVDSLRLPAADSLSMTLDGLYVDIMLEPADQLQVTSSNKELTKQDLTRFAAHHTLMNQYLESIGASELPEFSIHIDSHIPPGVGLASSAAVFSALAVAVAKHVGGLTNEQTSVLARLGSGSASRSIFGGYVAMENSSDDIGGATARQIADEQHWKLYDFVIVPDTQHKKVGSTQGHAGAHTSPHFAKRIKDITTRRQQECIDAIMHKDFEKLQHVSEEDALNMHHCMETQDPPLHYLSPETHRIIKDITSLRTEKHLPVLYTMDAGPTVHLICTEEAKETIRAFAHAQKTCKVFEAKVGSGAHCL